MGAEALAALLGALASAVILEAIRALIRRSQDRDGRRFQQDLERRRSAIEQRQSDREHIRALEQDRDHWRQRYYDLLEHRIRAATLLDPPPAP
jgi:DNA repair exonuclease SbcCD ATPase subunit